MGKIKLSTCRAFKITPTVLGALTALFLSKAMTESNSPSKFVGGCFVLVPTYSTELKAFGIHLTSENLNKK